MTRAICRTSVVGIVIHGRVSIGDAVPMGWHLPAYLECLRIFPAARIYPGTDTSPEVGRGAMATRASWRLAEALSRAEHRVSRRISAALRSVGMSLEQWRVLSLLSDGAGHTMSDIARDVMLPAATLTRVIDRLVEVNLVYRRGDLGDRRRVLVFVSPRGRSLYRKLAGTVDREEAALMAGIRDDDAATLGDLLKTARRAVTARESDIAQSSLFGPQLGPRVRTLEFESGCLTGAAYRNRTDDHAGRTGRGGLPG